MPTQKSFNEIFEDALSKVASETIRVLMDLGYPVLLNEPSPGYTARRIKDFLRLVLYDATDDVWMNEGEDFTFAKLVNIDGMRYAVIHDDYKVGEQCVAVADIQNALLGFAYDDKYDLANVAIYRFIRKYGMPELTRMLKRLLPENADKDVAEIARKVLDNLRKSMGTGDIIKYMTLFPDDIDAQVVKDLLEVAGDLYTLRGVNELGINVDVKYVLNKLDYLSVDREVIRRMLEKISSAVKHPYYLVVQDDVTESSYVDVLVALFDEDAPRGTVIEDPISKSVDTNLVVIDEVLSEIFMDLDIEKFTKFMESIYTVFSERADVLLRALANAIKNGFGVAKVRNYGIVFLPVNGNVYAIVTNDDVYISNADVIMRDIDIESAISKIKSLKTLVDRKEIEKLFRHLVDNEILSKLPQDIAEKIIEKFYEYVYT